MKVYSTPTVRAVLKYHENGGIKDLGSLNERQISKGRMNEIEHRVYHTISDNQNNPDGDIHVMPKER